MIARLENVYEFQDGADLHSTSSSSSPATTILVDNSEVVSRTIAALITDGEPAYWNTETLDQIFNDEPSIQDEMEAAKVSR